MQVSFLPLAIAGLVAALSSGAANSPDQVAVHSLGILDQMALSHDRSTDVNGRGGDGEERSAKTGAGRSAFERRWLAAKKEHEKAKELANRALQQAHGFNTARRLYRAALTHDTRALHMLEGLEQGCKGDVACVGKVNPVLRTVAEHMARTHFGIADLYRNRAAELVSKGLRKTRSLPTARRFFLTALRQQALAEKAVHDVRILGDADASIRRLASKTAGSVRNETIRIHLHIAHLYTTRENYNRALRWVNGALAMDPEHETALQTRARIEIAISNNN